VLATICLFIYHFMSDKDFSFLMTLGSIAASFAFVMLFLKMMNQGNCAGISLKSMQMYTIVFFFRFISIFRHEGYLPFDKTGDWMYQTVEFASLALCSGCLYLMYSKYKATYDPNLDAFGAMDPVPSQFGIVWLVAPALLLALLVHPNLNNVWVTDVSWTFALYCESVAVLPQLYMFQKGDGGAQKRVESFISHYVFALGFSRAMNLWFWVSSYHELADKNTGAWVGWFVVLAQMLQMVLMADFFYFYLKAMQKGVEMTLPTSLDNV
jgi:ER lumen protein retaining receptor